MPIIRVKIRNGDDPSGQRKLLKFDESIDFECLLRKIASKLGIESSGDASPRDFYNLTLGADGEAVVEDTDDVEHGDELVMKTKIHQVFSASSQETQGSGNETFSRNEGAGEDDSLPNAARKRKIDDSAAKFDSNSDGDDGVKNPTSGTGIMNDEERKKVKTERASGENDDDDGDGGSDEDGSVNPDIATSRSSEKETNDDDDSVEADIVTSDPNRAERMAQRKNPQRSSSASTKMGTSQDDAIELSSDEESDEDDYDSSVEDGSDGWEGEDDDDDDDGDDDDDESLSQSGKREESDFDDDSFSKPKPVKKERKKSGKGKPKAKESPLKVVMDEKDVPSAPGKPSTPDDDPKYQSGFQEVSTLAEKTGKKKADQNVKDRIIKLLNTGFHSESNEHEAKNAMKLAQRLMQKHNLSQAILLKERNSQNKEDDGELLKGGMVTVDLVNSNTGKPAVLARWASSVAAVVATNFGVESYQTVGRGRKCSITFYGIYTNAQLAGYAYRVSAERIAQMTAEYTPEQSWHTRNISTKSSRLSYALGMVTGIRREVDENIRREKEQRERKLERARTAMSKGEAYEESDDEDNEGSGFAMSADMDLDDPDPITSNNAANDSKPPSSPGGEEDSKMPASDSKKTPISGTELKKRAEELRQETQGALALVDHKKKVAEQVLEDNGVKVGKSRKRPPIKFDSAAHRQGVEDSKEIDINQRAIRHEVKIKKEEK